MGKSILAEVADTDAPLFEEANKLDVPPSRGAEQRALPTSKMPSWRSSCPRSPAALCVAAAGVLQNDALAPRLRRQQQQQRDETGSFSMDASHALKRTAAQRSSFPLLQKYLHYRAQAKLKEELGLGGDRLWSISGPPKASLSTPATATKRTSAVREQYAPKSVRKPNASGGGGTSGTNDFHLANPVSTQKAAAHLDSDDL